METEIGLVPENRVAKSGLITLDLETLRPRNELIGYDIKQNLYLEQVLREKDFREALLAIDWTVYKNLDVHIYCSVDAIVPLWAYMLLAGYLQPFASHVLFGSREDALNQLWVGSIQSINEMAYLDKKVVIKGCGEYPIPESAYVSITTKLKPVVKSLFFGEPCSTVPLFKKSLKGMS